MKDNEDLTRNESLVLAALSKSESPLSAYSLLDKLRDDGMRAPPQVYRALEKLVEHGLVHKVESLSAFVACQDPACERHTTVVLLICEGCGHVSERNDGKIGRNLSALALEEGFRPLRTSVELRGRCAKC